MIRFKKVWDLYEEGEVSEKEPIDDSTLCRLASEEGEEQNKVIDELVTLQTAHLTERIGLIVTENPDMESLADMISEIEQAEQKAATFLDLRVLDNYVYGHVLRVINLGDQYDRTLVDSFNSLYDLFKTSNAGLEQAEKTVEVSSARQKSDQDYVRCKRIFDLASRREIASDIDDRKATNMQEYGERKEAIDKLRADIGSLYGKYKSISLDKSSLREFKALRKKIKNKWYSKGEIVKGCIGVEYIEGIARLKELEEDIRYLTSNRGKVAELRDSIASGISRVAKDSKDVGPMVEGTLSLNDLSKLTAILNSTPIGKHDSHEEVIYLGDQISKYKKSAVGLMKKVHGLLLAQAEAEKEYHPISNDVSSDIKALEDKRAALTYVLNKAESCPSEVKRALTGWKTNVEGYIGSLRKTEETKEKIEADISSAQEKLQDVYSLLDSMGIEGIEGKQGDVRNLRLSYNPSAYDACKDNPYLGELAGMYMATLKELESSMIETKKAFIRGLRRLEPVA